MQKNADYTGASGLNCVYRIALVYDKQSQGTAPLVSDIWAQVDNAGSLSSSITASVNPLGRDRFVILYDRFINSWATTINITGWTYGKTASLKKFLKLKNAEALYNTGNTGTISDIESGSLFLVIMSSRGTLADNPFTFTYDTRLRWTD